MYMHDKLSLECDSVLTALARRLDLSYLYHNYNGSKQWVYYDTRNKVGICAICGKAFYDKMTHVWFRIGSIKEHGIDHLKEYNLLAFC